MKYSIYKRLKWQLLRKFKWLKGIVSSNPKADSTKIFVVGCQRSGTTLLMDIFEKDFQTVVYREGSNIFKDDGSLRLKELGIVKKEFERRKSKLIVAKPLLDSQNCNDIIKSFPNSKAVWIFRNYKDVASSNLKLFGINNGISDIKPIYEKNKIDWRAEKYSNATRHIIKKFFSFAMNPYDAAALFWYSRNIIFFEQRLNENKNIILCNYEELVENPLEVSKRLYDFIGVNFPGKRIVSDVHIKSKGKGKNIKLSADVESLCTDLLIKLNRAFLDQSM